MSAYEAVENTAHREQVFSLMRAAINTRNDSGERAQHTRDRLGKMLSALPFDTVREYVSEIALGRESKHGDPFDQANLLDALALNKPTADLARRLVLRDYVPEEEVVRLTHDLANLEKRNKILRFVANNHLPLNVVPVKENPSNAVLLAFPDSLPTVSPNVDTSKKGKWYSIGIFAHDVYFYNIEMLRLLKAAVRNAQTIGLELNDYLQLEKGKDDLKELVSYANWNFIYKDLQNARGKFPPEDLFKESNLGPQSLIEGSLIRHPDYHPEILMLYLTDRNDSYQMVFGQHISRIVTGLKEPFVVTDVFLEPFDTSE